MTGGYMPINGITYSGKHSQIDFGATTKQRLISNPAKRRVTETVPYSNVIYDFSTLYGAQTYGERPLVYIFTLSDNSPEHLVRRVGEFKNWLLTPSSKRQLRDDRDPDHYYKAVCTLVSENYIYPTVCEITATFAADPLRGVLNPFRPFTAANSRYPDMDGSGTVTAADAAIIQEAAAIIGAGGDPGLTPAQMLMADTNRDGKVNASDAAIVLQFTASAGAGTYTNDPAGWAEFLNDYLYSSEEVI